MPKTSLFILALTVIIASALFTLFFSGRSLEKELPKSQIDTAINQAKFLYRQRQQEGFDFSNGPCISNALMPDWVADIAHNPRSPEDDLPQNQCVVYIEGRAKHFVELDPEGNLIRAR